MLIKNRTEWLMNKVDFEDKEVLELGCVGMGKYDNYRIPWWFHRNIKTIAKSVIGLDYNKLMVEKLQKIGYDIKEQDLNKDFDLNKKFDIITANEILEHLTDPSNCLKNVFKHLKDDGIFVLSTPHVWSHYFFLQRLLVDKIKTVSLHDHKFWWDKDTLTNLLNANGFEVIEINFGYAEHSEHPIKDSLIFKPIVKMLPERMGRNLMMICRKKL